MIVEWVPLPQKQGKGKAGQSGAEQVMKRTTLIALSHCKIWRRVTFSWRRGDGTGGGPRPSQNASRGVGRKLRHRHRHGAHV